MSLHVIIIFYVLRDRLRHKLQFEAIPHYLLFLGACNQERRSCAADDCPGSGQDPQSLQVRKAISWKMSVATIRFRFGTECSKAVCVSVYKVMKDV